MTSAEGHQPTDTGRSSGDGPFAGVDDAALLRRTADGDADAFGELFRRHRDRLWAVALRTLGNREDAADALQDAMVSAFRRAGSYRGEAAVTTWLHRVVVNACLDRVRRESIRTTDPLAPDDDRTSGLAVERDAMADRLTELTVVEALGTLPFEQRAALVLVDLEGYSVDDAARILAVAPGTIKSRCARGRARLLPLVRHLRGTDEPGPALGPTGTATQPASETRHNSVPDGGNRAPPDGVAPTTGPAPGPDPSQSHEDHEGERTSP